MNKDKPAFPPHHPDEYASGLTAREYYIGQALAGICANPHFFGACFQQHPAAAADFARAAADAVLNETPHPATGGGVGTF